MSLATIFVSSVQKELAVERHALRDFVEGDPLLRRFFKVFLFEDLPASDRRADAVYLDQVDRCGVYVGLFGNEYGWAEGDAKSPTELEFDRATAQGKPRLIFVKGTDDKARHPRMAALIRRAGAQLIRRRFQDIPDLTAAFYASLVDHLATVGTIQTRPFDERPCPDATVADLSVPAVTQFLRLARAERQFPLPVETPVADVLAHLHLLHEARPTNAAVLLFGREPQRFLPCAEVRCMHFHGTEIQRPVPFYRIFKGTLFEQVDMALDFVLSKLNRSVGTRAESVQAPVRYEIPPDVVREAIVNAVAHRDYTSSGAVQVSVFADRVEVWNPGTLLPPLTTESLRHPHGSLLRNPRLCEALFLGRYIEKYGTGTLMMIRECAAHALPEPDFTQRGGEFTIALSRDWLTEKVMAGLGLNDRQQQMIAFVRVHGRASNRDLRQFTGVTDRTILRDLNDLLGKGVLQKVGIAGRATYYLIALQTRHKSDKPDIEASGTQTRHKPDKPDRVQPEATAPTVPLAADEAGLVNIPRSSTKSAMNQPNRPSSDQSNRARNVPSVPRPQVRPAPGPTSQKKGAIKGPKGHRQRMGGKTDLQTAHNGIKRLMPKPPAAGPGSESRSESGSEWWRTRSEWRSEWRPESVHHRIMVAIAASPASRSALAAAIGHKSVSRALRQALSDLMTAGLVAYTMPEKPNSRLQRYRAVTPPSA